jgi:carboxyl-terminal processing protease
LRGNPGGLLDAAVNVCEKFLKKNDLVVSVIGRDTSGIKKYYSSEEPLAGTVKMAVLVDNNSASASEIVAGALQDHDRAIIIGSETYGKGLVQTILPLSYNASLKITTAKYYTPSGRCIQKINYSKNNKVFSPAVSLIHNTFSTDNKRAVYDAGGIKPDSVVSRLSDANIVKDMLAKGIFFHFANYYFDLHPIKNEVDISGKKLFREFEEFLNKEDYKYLTQSETQLTELINTTENEKYNEDLIAQLKTFSAKLSGQKSHEMNIHKEEILASILEELAARYDGNNGRIKEALKNDMQFKTAANIMGNESLYSRILKSNIANK